MHVVLMGKSEEPVHGRKANSQSQWLNYTAFEVREFKVLEELINITNMGSLCSEETLNIVTNTDFYNV